MKKKTFYQNFFIGSDSIYEKLSKKLHVKVPEYKFLQSSYAIAFANITLVDEANHEYVLYSFLTGREGLIIRYSVTPKSYCKLNNSEQVC